MGFSQSTLVPPAPATAKPAGSQWVSQLSGSFAEVAKYQSAWNELVHRSGADIYQTFEWCRLWWRHYGSDRKLQLQLCFSGAELIGVIPAFIEPLRLGPTKIRVAKLIGSDFSLQFCNLAVMPDAIEFAVSQAVHHFLSVEKCDVLIIGPLSGPGARIAQILAAARTQNEFVGSAECLGNSCATRFDLPETYDKYQNGIGSRQRGNFCRALKQISSGRRVVIDAVSEDTELPSAFDQFRSLHEAQWKADGKLGHFGDWPRAADFNRDLIVSFGKAGMVRFFRILADGIMVSCQFCFMFGKTNYWRLPSRSIDPNLEKLSLGKMGLIAMVETSIAQGAVAIEGGRGHYDYKIQLGGCEWPLRTLQFTRRGIGISMRVRMFRLFARALNLVYYRIFFVRLASKFPILKRPLWSVWIRSMW